MALVSLKYLACLNARPARGVNDSMRRICALALLSILCVAQSTSEMKFEVATVRQVAAPNRFGGTVSGGPGTADPGQISFKAVPMMRLLMWAYQIPLMLRTPNRAFGAYSDQISGPAWMETGSYDILAKVPPGTTQEQAAVMMQNLLRERFGLRFHKEPRMVAGYELTVGKNGLKMRPAADPNAARLGAGMAVPRMVPDRDGFPTVPAGLRTTLFNTIDNGNMRVTGQSQSIEDLINTIVTSLNDGKRVVDKTGLTGLYDFKMDLALSGGFRRPGGPPLGPDDALGPDIFEAVDKSLGLKLQKAEIPIDVIVVDHLEETPSEN